MSQWWDNVVNALDANEVQTAQLPGKQGRLLISEHGARILGCEMPGVERNLFFLPQAMQDPAGAAQIVGGDRLWIAPEIGWYWPSLDQARDDPRRFASTPPQIDPGHYAFIERSDSHAVLDNHFDVTDIRDGKTLALYATREFRMIDPPSALGESAAKLSSLSFAITHTLAWAGGEPSTEPGAVAGAWDILQLPPRGTVVCPTTHRVDQPRSYYEPFGDKHVKVDDRAVRFLIDSQHRIKMGLLAEQTTGRMAYYQSPADRAADTGQSSGSSANAEREGGGEGEGMGEGEAKSKAGGGESTLIVRVFGPQPGEPYCDLPRSEDASKRIGGDALEAYNHSEGEDQGMIFGEMEYHEPCLVGGQKPDQRTGQSVTHVLVGDDHAVRQAGEKLIGVPIDAIE